MMIAINLKRMARLSFVIQRRRGEGRHAARSCVQHDDGRIRAK
jgi:hypothetical protein